MATHRLTSSPRSVQDRYAIITSLVSILLGWLLKIFSDSVSNRHVERKHINRLIFLFYKLNSFIEYFLINYEIFKISKELKDSIKRLASSNSEIPYENVLKEMRDTIKVLAEIDPVFACDLEAYITSIEHILELAKSENHLSHFKDDKDIFAVILTFRNQQTELLESLSKLRNYIRNIRKKKDILEASIRNESVINLMRKSVEDKNSNPM
ncbi:hypothetical protein [Leptospira interrogans]|uniref:hypothetical protein n=1 Tax=Leptospira interrogans TaxID=173 RepID=UPI000772EC57|nr:hypothetical protein [Leptospira interrogans]